MPWWGYIIIWGTAAIIAVVIEVSTEGLTSVWFALAALISLILAAFKAKPLIQLICFVCITIILLCITRPLIKKFMSKEIVRTNSDRLIQMVGIVTKPITPGEIGEVRINSELWRAFALPNETIMENEKVIVRSISGNKLLVSKINND